MHTNGCTYTIFNEEAVPACAEICLAMAAMWLFTSVEDNGNKTFFLSNNLTGGIDEIGYMNRHSVLANLLFGPFI